MEMKRRPKGRQNRQCNNDGCRRAARAYCLILSWDAGIYCTICTAEMKEVWDGSLTGWALFCQEAA